MSPPPPRAHRLLFVLFSAPFWFAGASLVGSGGAPLFTESSLAIDTDGVLTVVSGAIGGPQCTLRSWRLLRSAAGPATGRRPPGRVPKPSSTTRRAPQAVPSIAEVVVNMEINGVPTGGYLQLGSDADAIWGVGLQLAELDVVRDLVEAWHACRTRAEATAPRS